MRFLHLSDLHIGKSVNGFSMLAEQRHVLQQIIGYVQTEQPEAVVIAGDVYDRAVPGVEALKVFDDFLTALAQAEVAVLLIAGNHDSPERLAYANRLLTDRQLYLCGAYDGKMSRVTLTDLHGPVHFWLLPFIKPSSVRGLFEEESIETYEEACRAAITEAGVDYTQRNVLIAHQFFTKAGVTALRSESELNPVGGLDAIDAGVAEGFDYVALGHLHGAQGVGAEHIRYAGSPLKYSFSEIRHSKSITQIDLEEKGRLTIKALPLTPLHDMREIRGELEQLLSAEVAALADPEDYLRVILTDEAEIIDPMGKIRSVYPNVMALGFDNSRIRAELAEVNPDIDPNALLSPYDLFCEFFLDLNGAALSEEQAKIVRELLEGVVDI